VTPRWLTRIRDALSPRRRKPAETWCGCCGGGYIGTDATTDWWGDHHSRACFRPGVPRLIDRLTPPGVMNLWRTSPRVQAVRSSGGGEVPPPTEGEVVAHIAAGGYLPRGDR
jgi:hypothetical protein